MRTLAFCLLGLGITIVGFMGYLVMRAGVGEESTVYFLVSASIVAIMFLVVAGALFHLSESYVERKK